MLDPWIESIDLGDNVTETEAEELVAQYIDSIGLDDSWEQLDKATQILATRLDQFHMICWDVVTGEGADFPWRFPGFVASVRHLAAYEREHDRHHRIAGATSCSHIGFSGSDDTDFEDLRSQRFRLGLQRLVLRVCRDGYRPSDAADLVALCNGTLSTLHVDYAGFAKDLLWSSSSHQVSGLLDVLEITDDIWREWVNSTDAYVDKRGYLLAIERMGENAWDLLCSNAQHFVATALLHLEEQGHAPQLDYAPISIEVVKALEVELAEVLAGFRQEIMGHDVIYNHNDHSEDSLSKYLAGGKAPTLGAVSYLLRTPEPESSPLRVAFYEYLTSLPNAEFLTSNSFVKRGLQRVINKYRNGGAHDSPISESNCRECIETLIGTKKSPGFIPLVAGWKNVAQSALGVNV